MKWGSGNVCIGANSLANEPSGEISNSIFIGRQSVSGHQIANSIAIGYEAQAIGSNRAMIGNSNVTDAVFGGRFGVSNLHAKKLVQTSDQRIKTDIKPSNTGLDFINQLNPVTFKYKNPTDYPEEILDEKYKQEIPESRPKDDTNIYDGLIAQDVEEILDKEEVEWNGVQGNNGIKKLDYTSLIMPLINAIKELTKKNEKLTNRITEIEKKNNP